jgi:hypothetical protein
MLEEAMPSLDQCRDDLRALMLNVSEVPGRDDDSDENAFVGWRVIVTSSNGEPYVVYGSTLEEAHETARKDLNIPGFISRLREGQQDIQTKADRKVRTTLWVKRQEAIMTARLDEWKPRIESMTNAELLYRVYVMPEGSYLADGEHSQFGGWFRCMVRRQLSERLFSCGFIPAVPLWMENECDETA